MKSIVSRWLPERLQIAIWPERVVLARVEHGWRSTRVTETRIVEVTDVNRDRPWQAALAALGKVLADFGKANTSATVVLSNGFVRYAVIPWRDSVANAAEQAAFSRHCFRNIYGDLAEHWDIRVSDGGFRRNALASAVDHELPAELGKIFAERKISLSSVQPNFMAACNRFRRQLGAHKSGCLAVLEPRRVAFGIFDRTGWRALTVRRISGLNPRVLVPVLARELQSAEPAELPEHVFVAAVGPSTSVFFPSKTHAWFVRAPTRLPGLSS